MNNKKSNKRSKSRKCAVYGCSLIKRAKLAKLGRDDLRVNQPHPEYDQLVFKGYSETGSEQWRTLDELENEDTRMARYKIAEQSPAQRANALKRKQRSEALDEEAADLAKFYETRGMELKAFRKHKQSIQKRLLTINPDIVIKSDADREQREARVLVEMAEQRELSCERLRLDNEAKMERARENARKIQERLKKANNVKPWSDFGVNPERPVVTQEALNELSNSRYELPECLSNYQEIIDDEMTDSNY